MDSEKSWQKGLAKKNEMTNQMRSYFHGADLLGVFPIFYANADNSDN